MDFSDERYVRLYTRDSTTWKRMGWEGQCTLCQLLRRVDRIGSLEIEDMSPAAAVSLHTGGPISFVAVGIERLLELGVVEHRGSILIIPRFLEAQEAATSDRQRAKESRERRRNQLRSDTSQNVTKRHDASHDVTPRHSTPAVPSSPRHAEPAEEDRASADSSAASTAPACEVVSLQDLAIARADQKLDLESSRSLKASVGLGRIRMLNLSAAVNGKHREALVAIGERPDAEWQRVMRTLGAELMRDTNLRKTFTPTHILDHWDSHYLHGDCPGRRTIQTAATGEAF